MQIITHDYRPFSPRLLLQKQSTVRECPEPVVSRVAQSNRFVPIKLAATRQSNNFNSQFSWKNLRNVCSPYLISPTLLLVQMSTLKYRFISAILLPYVFTLKGRWALDGLHSSPLKLSRNTGKAFFWKGLNKIQNFMQSTTGLIKNL